MKNTAEDGPGQTDSQQQEHFQNIRVKIISPG